MRSQTFNQRKTIADILLLEVQSGWTKQRGILKAGAVYALGTVLALSADKKYVPLAPGAADSQKLAVAVLAEEVDATVADVPGVLIKRGAVVNSTELIWPEGITAAEQATALEQLEVFGIVAEAAQ